MARKRAKHRLSETDLARPVVEWLRHWQWDVWQEIQFSAGEERADICAVRHGLLWVVEAKSSLTIDVIAQAYRWPVHYRSIAVPAATNDRGRYFAYHVCKTFGVGILLVSDSVLYHSDTSWEYVTEHTPAQLLRSSHSTAKEYIRQLEGLPRDYAPAGSGSGSGHRAYTSFRGTMDRVKAYILKHQGCTITDIITQVEHHYHTPASARSAIPKWLQNREMFPWCRVEHDGKRLRFYADADEKTQ